jgi:protein-disulfide isomerase
MADQQTAKPLLPIIAITALSTALAVGSYFFYETLSLHKQEIKSLEDLINEQALEKSSPLILETITVESKEKDFGESPDNWIYGSPTARFTLVEMTDTECPYCAQHFPLLKSLVDASGGHVNAALMHVPVQGEASRSQAVAIECAGEQGGSDAAWKYAAAVFASTKGNGAGVEKSLAAIASDLGLNGKRFAACTDSIEALDRVKGDFEQALKIGIQQTPSTFIGDKKTGQSMVLQGSHASSEGIMDAIEKLSKGETP